MPVHNTFLQSLMPDSEPVPGKTYRADGWAYIDMPATTPEVWEDVMSILGEEVVILAQTTRKKGDEVLSVRGQFLLSPKGQEISLAKAKKK